MLDTYSNGFQPSLFSPVQFPLTLHCDHLNGGYHVLTHWHEDLEILYFLSGNASVICNQKSFVCNAGDILFINSSSFHSLERIKENCDYYCFSVGLSMLEILNMTPNDFTPYAITVDNHIKDSLKAIIEEYENKPYNYQLIIEMQMGAVLAYIQRNIKNSAHNIISRKKNDQYFQVRLALNYIHEHLKDKIALSDLCRITQLSPSQFSNVFKQYTGKTFVDYTNLMRCQYARTLFLTGKYSVTECAEMAGYNNLPYFARKYRDIFGETLSQVQVDKNNIKGLMR